MLDTRRSSEQNGPAGGSPGDVLTIVDASMRGQLTMALGEVAHPVHFDTVSAAINAAKSHTVRAVLVGPSALVHEGSPSVQRLAGACAGGSLIAVIHGWTPGMPERLLALGMHGIRDVIDLSSCESLGRLRTLLAHPEWEVTQRVRAALLPSLDGVTPDMKVFMSQIIRSAPTTCTIRVFSSALRVSPSTINSRFYRARLPSPKLYLATMRLLYAAGIMEAQRVSIAQVADRLHYSSPQSFGRHMRTHLGISAGEFREQYCFEVMLKHFAYRLVFRHRDTLRWFEPFGGTVSGEEHRFNGSS